MSTILGLCEEGLVPGAAAGSYTRSVLNKRYGLRALAALRLRPELLEDDTKMWAIASDSSGISSNYQLDVVRALWVARLIH